MAFPHLFLCRHGQTDWNADERLQGQEDIALNDLGRDQARRNGRTLRDRLGERAEAFRFLASPMARTRETMAIIRAELGLDPARFETDARLIELNFGDWQGQTLAEVALHDPAAVEERERRKWDFVPPGATAESYELLARRVAPAFDDLKRDGRPTILVAHGGVVRSFFKLYLGMTPRDAAHLSTPQDLILEVQGDASAWI